VVQTKQKINGRENKMKTQTTTTTRLGVIKHHTKKEEEEETFTSFSCLKHKGISAKVTRGSAATPHTAGTKKGKINIYQRTLMAKLMAVEPAGALWHSKGARLAVFFFFLSFVFLP
jgi:hypothetical protein